MVCWLSVFLLVILFWFSDGGVLSKSSCVMCVVLLVVVVFSLCSSVVNVVCMVGVVSILVVFVVGGRLDRLWYCFICGNISKLMLLWFMLVIIMFCIYGVFVVIMWVCNGFMFMKVLELSLKFFVMWLLKMRFFLGCFGL